MVFLLCVWVVCYIPCAIYANHRLRVNIRKGLIGNPDDPVEWVAMMPHMFLCWPYIMPKVAYLWRREILQTRAYEGQAVSPRHYRVKGEDA